MSKPKIRDSFYRAACVIPVVYFSFALPATADGVCKKRSIPTDFVPVAEFNSAQCGDGSDPFEMNAWEVERVRDGVVACKLPSQKVMGAAIASMVECGRVTIEKCAARFDGLPNAIVLKTPNSCANSDRLPSGFEVHCFAEDPGPSSPVYPFGRWGNRVGVVMVPRCGKATRELGSKVLPEANAWLYFAPPASSRTAVVCAGWSNNIILRRFHSPYCVARSADLPGVDEGLTAWVVVGRASEIKRGDSLISCVGKPPSSETRGRGAVEERRSEQQATRYDSICGGASGRLNAFRMTLGPMGWSVD